ncbi:transposable element Tcb2 transposase [Trichonephila clavipes]|nr:transposable element Tcb2 transposase [Trichonephila clavipes]
MGKLPHSDAFNRGQILEVRRMRHSISEIVRQLRFSKVDGVKKNIKNTSMVNGSSSRKNSKRTVQRSLHRVGFRSHRPTRVPLLNARHRAAHLAWTRQHRDWSVEDWKQIAWNDESGFQLLNADGRLRIWCESHEAMDFAYQIGTVQGHGGSIMVWGILSWHCLGSLVRVPTSLNAIRYVELMGDHLHPLMLFCYPHGN